MMYGTRCALVALLLALIAPPLCADIPGPGPRPERPRPLPAPADPTVPVVVQPGKKGGPMELHIPRKFLAQLRAEGPAVDPADTTADGRPHYQSLVAGTAL